MSKSIFISHAVKDKKFVNEFVKYVRLAANLTTEDIFCCSFEEMGITPGRYFVDFIKNELKDSKVVISIITPNYLNSDFSLCELGATWIAGMQFYPIILPPLDYEDDDGVLKGLQTIKIDKEKKLTTMIQEISEICGKPFKVANCQNQTEEFLRQLPTLLSTISKPEIINKDKFEEIQKTLNSYKMEYKELQDENERLNSVIEDLRKLKDKEEVDKILLQGSLLEEKFDSFLNKLRDNLSNNSMMVNYLLFRNFKNGDGITTKQLRGYEEYDRELQNEVENDVVIFNEDESTYYLNTEEYSIIRSSKALKEFEDNIEELDEDDFTQLCEFYKLDIKLSNKKFWEEVLKIHLPSLL